MEVKTRSYYNGRWKERRRFDKRHRRGRRRSFPSVSAARRYLEECHDPSQEAAREAALEAGEVPLDETLERFERAMLLKAHCQTLLEDAEARINKLLDEQGNTEPFAADADNDENEAGDTDDAR